MATIIGASSNDTITPSFVSPGVTGGKPTSGADSIDGKAGNDLLNGGGGIDTLIGGVGNDVYVVDTATDVIIENLNEGVDTVQSSVTYSLETKDNVENLTLTGAVAINGVGNGLNNVLHGNAANNILSGLDGNDTLNGGGGIDTLLRGVGRSTATARDCPGVVRRSSSYHPGRA